MATFTHTYNANGGTVNGSATWSTTYTPGNPAYLTPTPTRSGHTFLSWKVTSSSTGADLNNDYAANINIATQSNITLTAQWWENHFVNYNLSGGYFENRNWNYRQEKGPVVVTLREAPVKAGYDFLGWRDRDYNQALWAAGQQWGADVNTTMTAEWRRNSTNTSLLVYELDGGSGDAGSQTKNVGTAITLHGAPTKSGYKFVHWLSYQDFNYDGAADAFAAGASYNHDAWDRFTAIWQKDDTKTFTLNYDANGGSGAPSTQTATSTDSSYTFVISDSKPTREGYTFLGWATSAGATLASHLPGDNIKVSSTTTLYAIWGSIFTLNYNANGGSGAPDSQKYTKYGTSHTFTISSTTPTRSGYSFKGWATSSSATTASYQPSGTISVTSTTTLYAVWEKNAATFTLNYNANGGTGAPSSQTATSTDSSYTFTISSTTPTRVDYTFLGWSTSSTASTASYQPGGTISVSSTTVLYAIWRKNSTTYTLNYNANNGTGAPTRETVTTTEDEYTFTISTTTPTRSGYTFLGWATTANATSASYQPNDRLTLAKTTPTITLYAVWTAVTKNYTLNYNANGGTGAPSSQTVTSTANSYTFNISTTRPTRSKYKFLGWATSASATSAAYESGDKITVTATTTTLYAVWEEEQEVYTYILAYDANGGSGAPSPQTHSSTNSSHKFTIDSKRPTRSGYTFLGWAISSTATSAAYQPSASITVTATTTTLYAVWQINSKTFTLNYNANGGTGAPATQTQTASGSSYTFNISTTRPTRTNYTFLGWALSATATATSYQPGETINVTGTTTLYAVWAKSYNLVYNTNGGSASPASQSGYSFDNSYTFKVTTSTPTKDGCTFLGWSTSASATTASYTGGSDIVVTTTTTTLYAVWSNNFTLIYIANGGTGAPANDVGNTAASEYRFTISTVIPVRPSYTFLGWSISSTATAAQYEPGSSINVTERTTTLYAVWSYNIYNISFDARPSTMVIPSITCEYNKTVYLPDTIPTVDNGQFNYWTHMDEIYTPGSSFTLTVESDVTLTARYSFGIILSFNANGGSNAPEDLFYKGDETVHTFHIPYAIPVYTGHRFLGWALEKNSTIVDCTIGSTFIASGNTTLYAVWELETYNIRFNLNGGYGSFDAINGQIGSTVKIYDDVPLRSYYEFEGWSTKVNETPSYHPGDNIQISEHGDITLYAKWIKGANHFRLTFDSNGGDLSVPLDVVADVNDDTYETTIGTVKPNRTGYIFLGWSVDKYGTDQLYDVNTTIILKPGDTTLYAAWMLEDKSEIYTKRNGRWVTVR